MVIKSCFMTYFSNDSLKFILLSRFLFVIGTKMLGVNWFYVLAGSFYGCLKLIILFLVSGLHLIGFANIFLGFGEVTDKKC